MRYAIAILSLGVVLSCSDGIFPANDVSGAWAADFTIPGSSLQLNLAQGGQHITGSGSYAIEAGPAGTLQLSGTYDRPAIALVLHYDSGRTLTYSGVVDNPLQMTGTLADSLGPGVQVTFTRH
jgi:hypothetical protein